MMRVIQRLFLAAIYDSYVS